MVGWWWLRVEKVIYLDIPVDEGIKRIIKRAKQMETDRKKALKLNVSFFDSSTAKVWT